MQPPIQPRYKAQGRGPCRLGQEGRWHSPGRRRSIVRRGGLSSTLGVSLSAGANNRQTSQRTTRFCSISWTRCTAKQAPTPLISRPHVRFVLHEASSTPNGSQHTETEESITSSSISNTAKPFRLSHVSQCFRKTSHPRGAFGYAADTNLCARRVSVRG